METGTSKTSSIKALLIKGWYERWTDIQWGIHIKTILPRGVSGDAYNLADVILQQALVGYAPNELLLSYLIHCLNSQLVSYAAVLSAISKCEAVHKQSCVKWLLSFLESILDNITCRTKPEESALPVALLSTAHWLMFVYYTSMVKSVEMEELITKPILVLDKLLKNSFTLCLLYVAKFEDRDTYCDILKRCRDTETLLESRSLTDVSDDIITVVHNLRKLDSNVKLELPPHGNGVDFSIQSILLITVLLNPTTETQTFVNHLLTVQQLKGYSNSKLYMYFVRASFMNLNEALKEEEASQWGAFVYIKVPTIIQQLAYYYHGFQPYDGTLPEQASAEIVQSFLSLTEYCPLLHTLNLRTSCSTIEYLLVEMVATHTISEEEKNQILAHVNEIWRRNKYEKVGALEGISAPSSGSIPTVILNTGKPALARIMKTLDTEFEKIQEALLSILGQFINGKSFEVILALATVKEVLHTFVMKLIKVNELCQQINPNEGKLVYTKSMLFDITFLILSAIVQRYGSKIIFGDRWGNSFFETWVKNCMVEEESNKAMPALVKGHDHDKIKALMNWLDSNELDIRAVPMKWGDVCLTMPAVMKEIQDGWRNNKLSIFDVKKKLDAIRACQVYSLSVCSISWVSSYMQILTHEELLKPRNMVQQFLNPPCDDSQLDLRCQAMKLFQQDNARDSRWWLALNIMCKMQYSVGPSMMPIKLFSQSSHCILSKEPVFKQLSPVWEKILKHGSLSLQLVQDVKAIFSITKPSMFIKFMIDEIMKQKYKRELNKAVDLLFGLFYFNIEECSIALLNYVPYLLFKPAGSRYNLIEPQSSAIARLVAYSIFAPAGCYSNYSNMEIKIDMDQDMDEYCSPAKMLKINEDDGDTCDEDDIIGTYIPKPAHPVFSAALLNAIDIMFVAFNKVTWRAEVISQDTYFVLRVLEQIVVCGKEAAKPILVRLPDNLVPNLIRLIPEEFSMKLILNLYNLNTTAGRKAAVRDLCLLRNLTVLSH